MVLILDQTGRELGTGSGFLVSADGKVVTNYHVVSMPGAAQAELRFADGGSYQADGILAMDPDRDLAVLRIRATGRNFQFLTLANSDRVQVGERVLAIGSPLAGLSTVNTENTVSDGIVSGIRDWSNDKMKVFQITAPVSPGSSGGALLNMEGEVIGVTFAQLVVGQNLNFAIPIGYVQSLLHDGPTKALTAINGVLPDDRRETEGVPTGSYTGKWQSSKFSVSGAASMTIRVADNVATAEIFLTGGEVTSASLSGPARRTGENIWTVELGSKHPKLLVRGIFRDNSFVGDYTYTRFLMLDQGQWVLTKE
jgi:S1-C subfamily serine protease